MKPTCRQAPCVFSVLVLAVFSLLWTSVTRAQEGEAEAEAPTGWTGSAELSAVLTSGNAESETLGLRTTLIREWKVSTVTLEAGGLRAESTTTQRFGIGTPAAFREVENSTTAKTAENYLVRGRYDRRLSERLFWYLGAAWDRNTFAGIDNRYVGTAGVGHAWFTTDDSHLKTTYGLSYTQQDDVVGTSDSFTGVRLSYDYLRALTSTTDFGSLLIADANLDETSDYRVDVSNWIAATMTDRLALKISLQVLYDNEPSLQALPLFDEAGEPTGETGLAPLDDLDLMWTAALVVKF